jgi:hypothetical protein
MRELDAAVERALGSVALAYERRDGGFTSADRFSVRLADGRRAFVKSAAAPNLAAWLRREHEVYAGLAGSFMPELLGFDDDGERVLLAIEDLSDADWVPSWDAGRIDAVLEALAELARAAPPPNTASVRETFAELWGRWEAVGADPEPFLSTGLRDGAWLERALPVLIDAAERAPVEGEDLCHLDVRSDNMCFRGSRVLLVDWNWASLANGASDVAAWLPSLHVEGGPPPWEVLPDAGLLAAWIAGVWAAVVGLPPPETAPNVRAAQRRQLAVVLDWVDRDLF